MLVLTRKEGGDRDR